MESSTLVTPDLMLCPVRSSQEKNAGATELEEVIAGRRTLLCGQDIEAVVAKVLMARLFGRCCPGGHKAAALRKQAPCGTEMVDRLGLRVQSGRAHEPQRFCLGFVSHWDS
ncbi:hypothetical protein MHYP_G00341600 [Metynnis hypsauchen]